MIEIVPLGQSSLRGSRNCGTTRQPLVNLECSLWSSFPRSPSSKVSVGERESMFDGLAMIFLNLQKVPEIY
jgi:hypothetical protein